MKFSLRQAICSFAFAVLLAGAGTAAAAACGSGAPGQSSACGALDFAQAQAALTQTVARLNAVLPPAGQLRLRAEQARFLRRRAHACRAQAGGFADDTCALRLTRARLAALQRQAAASLTPVSQSGHYTVPGTAMPWLWKSGGMNGAYPIGQPDGTAPIVLALAGLNAGPGQRLIIRYVSGEVSAGANGPQGDANGVAGPNVIGNNPAGGAIFPPDGLRPYPIRLGALVGAFADTFGMLASAPFALGDGPDLKLIPPGATQLQLGLNGAAADNTGSLVISVIAAPEGNIAGAARGVHGCAVFGGAVGPVCQNYPAWESGLWLPPPGSGVLHVVAIGGGGGGGLANPATGVGGAGGGSGKVITGAIPIPDGPILIIVGQGGAGAGSAKGSSTGGTGSIIGKLVARGGWGGQPGAGGSAEGPGGNSGGGGGGGGTYQASYDAGAGGTGGSGGDGSSGLPPTDLLAGFNGSAGGAGTAFPNFALFDGLTFGAGPGGAGGGFGAGGLTAAGVSCAGGGGGGGGGGGLLINQAGPRAGAAAGPELPKPCGAAASNGQGGLGYGAGGGGAGAGIAGPAGSGANGVVVVAW